MGGHGAPEGLRSCRTVTLRRSIGIRAEGLDLDPNDPAVVAALELVRL